MLGRTQVDWVRTQLKEKGEITRNECLRNYISHLSAIMLILKNEGWEFTTSKREGDYVYTVGAVPKAAPKKEPIIENGIFKGYKT